MNDTQSQTESLLDIVKGIKNQTVMLPEFQRDFRWELEQTYDLFDSLIKDIFIGTLIYGKPSFGMTLREIDIRPRKGEGSRGSIKTYDYSTDEIIKKIQAQNLRIVLDGQQRITSIFRAITGRDTVYLILKNGLDDEAIKDKALEEIFQEVSGAESATAISIRLSDAYDIEIGELEEDDDFNQRFSKTLYARKQFVDDSEQTNAIKKSAERIYRRAVRKLNDLYKQQKMVAYYMLDMNLDKFCVFFERSNSRGIQLNFTDILAAKLYHGFNLRKKIEEFESQSLFKLNREIVVRAIAYIWCVESGVTPSIDKKAILEKLDAEDFNKYWDEVCNLYTESLNYLIGQKFVLSQDWMPSENMIIPLMIFRRQIKGFDQITEEQRKFIEFWYWASIFANRYSTASNEVIIADSNVLTQIAKGEKVSMRGYFNRMRSLIAEEEDLFSYTKRSSAIYRGILNLLGYASNGLLDWNSTQKTTISMRLEDHHIYPSAYIASKPTLDVDQSEAEQLVDCVVNRTLIPKLLNIQIGKKSPQVYLSEIQQKSNPNLKHCLVNHLIPSELITDPDLNCYFKSFLEDRAKALFLIISKYAINPAQDIMQRHGIQTEEFLPTIHPNKLRLKEMINLGRIKEGDKIYIRKHPDQAALIIDGDTVEFQGQKMAINTWGQNVTGWSSINIYEVTVLDRTGQVLDALRNIEM